MEGPEKSKDGEPGGVQKKQRDKTRMHECKGQETGDSNRKSVDRNS